MQIGYENNAKNTGAEAEKLDFVVASNAAGKVVADFLMMDDYQDAGN